MVYLYRKMKKEKAMKMENKFSTFSYKLCANDTFCRQSMVTITCYVCCVCVCVCIYKCEKEMKEIWSRFSVTYTQLIYSSMLLTFITWVIALQGAIPWFPNSQRNDHQNTFLMKYLDNILPSQCEHEIWFISLFYWDTIRLHYNELDKFIVFSSSSILWTI